MSRRKEWRKALDAEVRRWSAMSCDALIAALRESQNYEITFESKSYQVEVVLLENTDTYVHVMLSIDDGSLSAFVVPLSDTFIRQKQAAE